jgi:hypothetical protein
LRKVGVNRRRRKKGDNSGYEEAHKIGPGRGSAEDDDRYCDWEVTVPELVEENTIIPHALRQRDRKLESSRWGKRK